MPLLRSELDLLRQAVFTEPDDQSPWFYRRWVLGQLQRHWETRRATHAASGSARAEDSERGAVTSANPLSSAGASGSAAVADDNASILTGASASASAHEALSLLREDVSSLHELASIEPGSKWPLLGIAQGLQAIRSALEAGLTAGPSGANASAPFAPDASGLPREAAPAEAWTSAAACQSDEGTAVRAELRSIYVQLASMDPQHAAYYRYCAQGLQA